MFRRKTCSSEQAGQTCVRLRRSGPVLCAGRRHEHLRAGDVLFLSARDVRPAERRVRRADDELQQLPGRTDLRRQWCRRRVRLAGRRLEFGRLQLRRLYLHAPHVFGLPEYVRRPDRRLRGPHAQLQPVFDGADLRRRRRVHADDVRGAQHRLWPRRRRLRQPHPQLRNVHASGDLRRRYVRPVR